MEITRLFDIVEKLNSEQNNATLLNRKEGKSWISYSSKDFYTTTHQVAASLIHLGFKKGDKAAIISTNRPEWNFVDFGCQLAGLVTVPIFPTIGANDLKFILNHSEARILFISDKSLYQKVNSVLGDVPELKRIYSFNQIDGVPHFSEFLQIDPSSEYASSIENIKQSVKPDDLLTIIYTSGTTGTPKGVMLSHQNLVSNILACKNLIPFEKSWRSLSFLPLNHIYERMVNSVYLYHGLSIYYLENLESIGDTAREIKPTVFVAVPRLIERVHERIMNAGEKLKGFKKVFFNRAVKIANQYEGEGQHGIGYNIQKAILDKFVFKKWREAMGGNLRYLFSGGAALNHKLERVFSCAGISILQGYGLTETSPVISVNRIGPGNACYGTVGPVIDGCEVKIAPEDGEILMRGPNKMIGYYKNPEATAEMIDAEGWLHTGDVGEWVNERFLKITDRKKEIFKTSAGKYIAPIAIENKIKECKFVENCMVVGEGQKFASALIVPSIANFKEYAAWHNFSLEGGKINEHPELKKIISNHIKEINKSLAPFEQLKRCEIVEGDWTVDGGEVTPKLSLKRKVIKEKYKTYIDKIYAVQELA